jgi:hypothetical protein
MRISFIVALLSFSAACVGACTVPHTVQYGGASDAERKLLQEARRDVYPDDVRPDPQRFRKSTLAWPGIVRDVQPDPVDPALWQVIVEHHYWDWMEDHSIQKAKAFLSPRGEGEFVCHSERPGNSAANLRSAMTVAYVRPVGIKDGVLHAACIMRFFPRDWYATDVFEYGRGGSDLKILRVPME